MKDPTFVSVIVRYAGLTSDAAHTLRQLDEFLFDRFAAYEIILVNDRNGAALPDSVHQAVDQIRGAAVVLEMAYDQGVETAMLAGLDRAMGDFVFEVDDGRIDYPIEILETMYQTARSGRDIVAAVPSNLPASTRFFYWSCNRLTSIAPPLFYERLRVSSRRAVDALLRQPERVRHRQVLYRFTGYRYGQVPYRSDNKAILRPYGRLAFGIDIFWSFNDDVGARLARVLGLAFIVVAVVGMVVTLARTHADPWWVLLASVGLFGFAGVFVLFAVTCEFLSLILREVRNRPLYTLDRTLTRTSLRPSSLTDPGAESQEFAYGERHQALHLINLATTGSSARLPRTSGSHSGNAPQ